MPGIRSRIQLCVAAGVVGIAGSPAVMALGLPAQRTVARLTAAALPEPLRAFYADRPDGVVERTIEPDGAWPREWRYRGRGAWHYLMLDAAAKEPGRIARAAAAREFPAQRAGARKLFRELKVKHGGELPWRLDALVDDLAKAFADGDEDQIVRLTGYVIHFATDASNPFAATRDRDGSAAGNPVFGAHALGDELFAHQNAAQRIGWELIRRNTERYREQIDPSTIRFELGVADVPFTTIEWMAESLARLDDLLTADRDILSRTGITDARTFLARSDEYYQLLDEACGEICVDNLRRATRLATTLLVTAWSRAGTPDPAHPVIVARVTDDPPAPPPPATGPSEPTVPANAAQQAAGFVASRNSKVFHSRDCAHVARISEKNRLHYATLREARASGKRPCKTCHPGNPPANARE